MLLAINAGNTNVVFALFEREKLVHSWRMTSQAQRTSDEYAVFLHGLMHEAGISSKNVTSAILGSVVPEANFHLIRLCQNSFDCDPLIVGAELVEVGLRINLDRPEEVGADRIMNAVGGLANYQPPFVVVDFGTATTFDVVDTEGNFGGGAIAPGINLSLYALHMATAKLPRVEIARPHNVIGKNTVEAIQSGIFWGYVGLIEGMIARIRQEFSQPVQVIATGGLAGLFMECVSGIDHFDQEITLRGLRLIYERNYRKQSQ